MAVPHSRVCRSETSVKHDYKLRSETHISLRHERLANGVPMHRLQTLARQDREFHRSNILVQDTPVNRYKLRSEIHASGPANCVKNPRLQHENAVGVVKKKDILSPKSRSSRKRPSEAKSSKDVSKKREHDIDYPNAVEALKVHVSVSRLENLNNRLSESSTQGNNQSSPMADKHSADVPNATVKTETMKEKTVPVLSFTDRKYSGQPRRLNIICEDKLKKSVSCEVLSKYTEVRRLKTNGDLACWICSAIKAFSNNVIRVWIGCQANEQNNPLFVAVVKQMDTHLDEKLKTIFPFTIIQRQSDKVSEEAMLCLKPESKYKYPLDEHRKLHETILGHSDSLMQAHSNLLIVSASPIKSRKAGRSIKKQTCIVFYVHIKGIIPLQEKPFPLKVGEFPVDVREGVFKKYSQAKLSLGNEICSAYGLAGRLGGFVRLSDGKLGCFTCCHLFDTDQSRADLASDAFNPAVYQTVQGDHNQRPFGKVVALQNNPGNQDSIGVDAALIEITDRLKTPENAIFRINPDSALESDDSIEFSSGEVLTSAQEVVEVLLSGHAKCKIVKYSERRKKMYVRTGIMNMTGNTVDSWWPEESDEKCKLYAQFDIRSDSAEILDADDTDFAKEGESGSLVFIETDDLKNKWAIGMVVGGINSNGSCIATPIWAVLDGFDLPRRLLSFEDQRLNRIELKLKDIDAKITGLHHRLDRGFAEIQACLPLQKV